MAEPAVQGDRIEGECEAGVHMVPNPSSGSPQPSPNPFQFVGPIEKGLEASVTIGGRAAAVVGSTGDNVMLHPGLHPTESVQVNVALQVGEVVDGEPTVTFGGKAAATSTSSCRICGGRASITTTISNVTIG
jgi:hypothetical protein